MASTLKPVLRSRDTVLRPVRPNLGIEAEFRRKLVAMVDEMQASVLWHVRAAYRANEPEIAQLGQDESPAAALRAVMKRMAARWIRNFEDAAQRLAKWFATAVHKRSDAAMRKILKDAGFAIEFRYTASMNDAVQAAIGQQVALIKSIPAQYLTQVEGKVMRAVQAGRAIGDLAKDIEQSYGVTKRRAQFIAHDQINKSTAVYTRVRQLEACGPNAEAIWVHSHAGREPRPTHVKAGREKQRYAVATGWHDPDPKVDDFIFPGQLPGCKCSSRLVIPALEALRARK